MFSLQFSLLLLAFVVIIHQKGTSAMLSDRSWYCQASAPCLRIVHPAGGVGDVGMDVHQYQLEIMVHRRENDPGIQHWWSQQPIATWNIVTRWYRLLETNVRAPIPACRNNLECTVSLLGEDDIKLSTEDVTGRIFSYKHFYVEVQFEGHPAKTGFEIILRREREHVERNNGEWHEIPEQLYRLGSNTNINSGIPMADNSVSGVAYPHSNIPIHSEVGADSNLLSNAPVMPDALAIPTVRTPAKPPITMPHRNIPKLARVIKPNQQVVTLVSAGATVTLPVEEDYVGAKVDFWNPESALLEGLPLSDGTQDHLQDAVDGLGPGGITLIILAVIALLSLLIYCCCFRRSSSTKRNAYGRGTTVKLPPVGSRRSMSWWERFVRWIRPRNNQRHAPYPRHGLPLGKGSYSPLSTDSDDEELFPGSSQEDVPRASIISEKWEDVKRKSSAFARRASKALSISSKRSSKIKKSAIRLARKGSGFLSRCFGAIKAFFVRCCVGRKDADDYKLLSDGEGDTSDEEEDDSLLSQIVNPSAGPPQTPVNSGSKSKDSSFKPKTDISGRFVVHHVQAEKQTETNKPAPGNASTSTSGQNSRTDYHTHNAKVVPACVHSPGQKCGLHCIQRHHNEDSHNILNRNSAQSSETSSAVSGGDRASETTSVTSSSSDARGPPPNSRRDLSVGDAPATSECPPLPRVLQRTKQGFRRENQRMDALMRQWERRSTSCVVIDETQRRDRENTKKMVTIGRNRRAVSVGSRFLNIDQPQSERKYPPRLLERRIRLTRSVQHAEFCSQKQKENERREMHTCPKTTYYPETKCKNLQGQWSPSKSSLEQKIKSPTLQSPQLRTNINDLSSHSTDQPSNTKKPYTLTSVYSSSNQSSIHTSEIDELISDGSVSVSTNQIEVSSSSDDYASIPSRKTTVLKSTTCEIDRLSSEEEQTANATKSASTPKTVITRQSEVNNSRQNASSYAAALLESAAKAFLTSDDESSEDVGDYYEDFWESHRKRKR